MNRDDIFTKVKATLVELFEVDEDAVTLDAQLYQDLELDSIDAIDLVVHLQNSPGKKDQSPKSSSRCAAWPMWSRRSIV